MPEPPKWQAALDDIVGAITRLDQAAIGLPTSEAGDAARVLRGVNRHIWGIINTLEAGHLQYLYDVHDLIKDLANHQHITTGELFEELTTQGALRINVQELFKVATRWGFDPTSYVQTAKEESDDGDE